MKRVIYVLAVLVLLGVFCYSGWTLWDYYSDGAESQAVYDDLAASAVGLRVTPISFIRMLAHRFALSV